MQWRNQGEAIAPPVKCLAPPCKIVHKSCIFCIFLKAYQINQVTEEKVFNFFCVNYANSV